MYQLLNILPDGTVGLVRQIPENEILPINGGGESNDMGDDKDSNADKPLEDDRIIVESLPPFDTESGKTGVLMYVDVQCFWKYVEYSYDNSNNGNNENGNNETVPTKPKVGDMQEFPDGKFPNGWLQCTGKSYLREQYPELFSVIGTKHGVADDTHFFVPKASTVPLELDEYELYDFGGGSTSYTSAPKQFFHFEEDDILWGCTHFFVNPNIFYDGFVIDGKGLKVVSSVGVSVGMGIGHSAVAPLNSSKYVAIVGGCLCLVSEGAGSSKRLITESASTSNKQFKGWPYTPPQYGICDILAIGKHNGRFYLYCQINKNIAGKLEVGHIVVSTLNFNDWQEESEFIVHDGSAFYAPVKNAPNHCTSMAFTDTHLVMVFCQGLNSSTNNYFACTLSVNLTTHKHVWSKLTTSYKFIFAGGASYLSYVETVPVQLGYNKFQKRLFLSLTSSNTNDCGPYGNLVSNLYLYSQLFVSYNNGETWQNVFTEYLSNDRSKSWRSVRNAGENIMITTRNQLRVINKNNQIRTIPISVPSNYGVEKTMFNNPKLYIADAVYRNGEILISMSTYGSSVDDVLGGFRKSTNSKIACVSDFNKVGIYAGEDN